MYPNPGKLKESLTYTHIGDVKTDLINFRPISILTVLNKLQ